ncbi:hypothetical protein Poli38472_008301 [Pythium oligandrum]|uniref:HSF-type DNA-binding domain-containing protein n=1 Tax=Pythium oligandrum TaxID=41045 RepID=A0A8K1CM88_PYTOL|nr:hypothetical protein Poli38472_008301 [Pythium oligandrum]|eukprot:TMW65659.1 hypothetical protein Poli38472_008301 [Pythium oligandrum]
MPHEGDFLKHLYYVLTSDDTLRCLTWDLQNAAQFIWHGDGEQEVTEYLQREPDRFGVADVSSFREELVKGGFERVNTAANCHRGQRCVVYRHQDPLALWRATEGVGASNVLGKRKRGLSPRTSPRRDDARKELDYYDEGSMDAPPSIEDANQDGTTGPSTEALRQHWSLPVLRVAIQPKTATTYEFSSIVRDRANGSNVLGATVDEGMVDSGARMSVFRTWKGDDGDQEEKPEESEVYAQRCDGQKAEADGEKVDDDTSLSKAAEGTATACSIRSILSLPPSVIDCPASPLSSVNDDTMSCGTGCTSGDDEDLENHPSMFMPPLTHEQISAFLSKKGPPTLHPGFMPRRVPEGHTVTTSTGERIVLAPWHSRNIPGTPGGNGDLEQKGPVPVVDLNAEKFKVPVDLTYVSALPATSVTGDLFSEGSTDSDGRSLTYFSEDSESNDDGDEDDVDQHWRALEIGVGPIIADTLR